jgi:hypothetical protein
MGVMYSVSEVLRLCILRFEGKFVVRGIRSGKEIE